MRSHAIVLTLAAGLALLAGCAKSTKAPFDPGVCYQVVPPEEGETGEPRFNVLARDISQIELCAAELEGMRVRFLNMGGSRREVMGSYQGQFIFIDRGGVSFARTMEGTRFFALARTGDGRLAVPGAIDRSPVAPAAPPAPAQ